MACVTVTQPPTGTTEGSLRTCLTPSFSVKRPGSLEYPRESRPLSLSRFMSNLFPLIAPLKKDEEPGAAQLRRERSTSHLMFISYKSLTAFYLSILRRKPETLQKDKQRLHFKKTAVAGSGCAFSDSFRNNKHRLLTQQTHHGGVAPTRSAWARQGSLKESGRKQETPSENKHFSWDEHCFLVFFLLFFCRCIILMTTVLWLSYSACVSAGDRGYFITF